MVMIDREECLKSNQIILQSNMEKEEKILRSMFIYNLHSLISFDAASFFLADFETKEVEYFPIHDNLNAHYINLYATQLVKKDEVIARISKAEPFLYRITDYVSLDKSELYHDFLKPQGVKFSQGMNFVWNNKFLGGVALFRNSKSKDFTDKELFILSQFQSHLARAIFIIVASEKEKEISREKFRKYYHLTAREMEIICLLTEKYSNKELSEKLFIQEYTTKTHLKNIFQKLDITSRNQIINVYQKFFD